MPWIMQEVGTITCLSPSLPIIIVMTLALAWHHMALYGLCCRTLVCWDDVGEREPSKVELIDETKEIVSTIRRRLQTA